LQHRPIHQFNGKKPKPSKVISVTARQQKFHKQLCNILLSRHAANKPFDSISPVVKCATINSVEGDIKEEASDNDVEAPIQSLDHRRPKSPFFQLHFGVYYVHVPSITVSEFFNTFRYKMPSNNRYNGVKYKYLPFITCNMGEHIVDCHYPILQSRQKSAMF
jgi:hypothetical protein